MMLRSRVRPEHSSSSSIPLFPPSKRHRTSSPSSSLSSSTSSSSSPSSSSSSSSSLSSSSEPDGSALAFTMDVTTRSRSASHHRLSHPSSSSSSFSSSSSSPSSFSLPSGLSANAQHFVFDGVPPTSALATHPTPLQDKWARYELECTEQIDECSSSGAEADDERLEEEEEEEDVQEKGRDVDDCHAARDAGWEHSLPSRYLDPVSTSLLESGRFSLRIASLTAVAETMDVDTLAHMHEAEESYEVSRLILRHERVQASMRPVLMDWLMEVAAEFRLQRETFYLAVNYVDRIMSCADSCFHLHSLMSIAQLPNGHKINIWPIERGNYQLLGISCLWLASKIEEIYPPQVSEFAQTTDGAYDRSDLTKMEHCILHVLQWRLLPATAHSFVKAYLKTACLKLRELSNLADSYTIGSFRVSHDVAQTGVDYFSRCDLFCRCMELIDLCTLDSNFVGYKPSALAGATLHIIYSRLPYRYLLSHCMRYSLEELFPCIQAIAHYVDEPLLAPHIQGEAHVTTRSATRRELRNELWTRQQHREHTVEALERAHKRRLDAAMQSVENNNQHLGESLARIEESDEECDDVHLTSALSSSDSLLSSLETSELTNTAFDAVE